MRNIPYGYKIANGKALVDEVQAEQIRKVYAGYLQGLGLMNAAKEAGLTIYHCSVKKLLQNKHYLGDEFYPAIIDQNTFKSALAEQRKRAKALGRIFEPKEKEEIPAAMNFKLDKVMQMYSNPFRQAEYVYDLIESEEDKDERN